MIILIVKPVCVECEKVSPEAIKLETYPVIPTNMDAIFRSLIFLGWRDSNLGFICEDCCTKGSTT